MSQVGVSCMSADCRGVQTLFITSTSHSVSRWSDVSSLSWQKLHRPQVMVQFAMPSKFETWLGAEIRECTCRQLCTLEIIIISFGKGVATWCVQSWIQCWPHYWPKRLIHKLNDEMLMHWPHDVTNLSASNIWSNWTSDVKLGVTRIPTTLDDICVTLYKSRKEWACKHWTSWPVGTLLTLIINEHI
jgi:hypothetical protein